MELKLDDWISKARCVVWLTIILLLLHVVVSTSGQQQQHNCQAELRSGQEAETGASARTPLGTTQLVMDWELSGAPHQYAQSLFTDRGLQGHHYS